MIVAHDLTVRKRFKDLKEDVILHRLELAIEGPEWIIIMAVIAVIFLWRPEKIVDVARALARAKREFERAQLGLVNSVTAELENKLVDDVKLLDVARKLGVQTYGLTREEIKEEIFKRLKNQIRTELQ